MYKLIHGWRLAREGKEMKAEGERERKKRGGEWKMEEC
jgi:hypothetical protein